MSETIFSPQQLIVLDALASGASVTQAAAEAGVHRNTIANWRRETANFTVALANAQYDRALLFREKAEELTDLAFDTLRATMSDEKASPSIRLKAALAVVNLVTSQVPPQKRVPITPTDLLNAPPPKRPETVPQNVHNPAQSAQPETPAFIGADVQTNVQTKIQTIHREGPKIGRNEPCPCGSGLKHKHCCLHEPLASAAA